MTVELQSVPFEPRWRGKPAGWRPSHVLGAIRDGVARIEHRVKSALHHRVRWAVVRGDEKHSGHRLELGYVGTRDNFDYLLDRLFGDHVVQDLPNMTYAWQTRSRWNKLARQVDLLVGDLPWPYQKSLQGDLLQAPAWVQQRVPLADDWQSVRGRFRKSAKSDVRLIRKLALNCRTNRSAAAKSAFYERFYLPLIRSRHGSLAHVESEAQVQAFCERGYLMEILRHDQVIACGLVQEAGDQLRLLWCGEPAHAISSPGAGAALTYFALVHAFERGLAAVNLNYSRALLNDGGFRFKRKWGGALGAGFNMHYLVFRPTRATAGVRSLLAANPMITLEGSRLVARLFGSAPLAPGAKRKLLDWGWIDGLHDMRVDTLFPRVDQLAGSAIEQRAGMPSRQTVGLTGSRFSELHAR